MMFCWCPCVQMFCRRKPIAPHNSRAVFACRFPYVRPRWTLSVGTTLDQAKQVLQKHRIEKLLVIDEDKLLKGLITVKDIQKAIKYPTAAKDNLGRLRVAAAIGATGDFRERADALVKARVDCLVIDTAHGHSSRVIEAVREIKRRHAATQLLAGNVGPG